MTAIFSVDRMIPHLRARDKRDVLRKLATASIHDAELPETVVLAAASQAADLAAFGPRGGVALPHAFVPGLRRPLATVATLTPAVEFEAKDGAPSDLVALLLSPAETAGDHLLALARIARRLRDPNVLALLHGAESRESMYVVMIGSEFQTEDTHLNQSSNSSV